MKISKEDLRYMKELLVIVGSIFIGFGFSELISSTKYLRQSDKIWIFILGGIMIFGAGHDVSNKKYTRAFLDIVFVILAILAILICRVLVP